MGEVLGALQAWYAAQCDNAWEREFGISIGTHEASGWAVRVDLVRTSLEGRELARDRTVRTLADWIEVSCDGYTFNAVGGADNLNELLAAFARFAGLRMPTSTWRECGRPARGRSRARRSPCER